MQPFIHIFRQLLDRNPLLIRLAEYSGRRTVAVIFVRSNKSFIDLPAQFLLPAKDILYCSILVWQQIILRANPWRKLRPSSLRLCNNPENSAKTESLGSRLTCAGAADLPLASQVRCSI
ncbi:MAG: hypothetical protein HC849_31370 [Oscillatoriales cyanobacterium RU_3_3]|nr:hypothetical protein [Microcoleus sp. SU_5_6]NJM63639.1 hypothetical protein [Oscillatoriales cyanobacterium RU_3_3]